MGELIGPLVALALGIAVSPIPIVALIVIVSTSPSSRPGVGFLLGWVTGILVALALFASLPSIAPDPDGASGSVSTTATAVLGTALVALGVGRRLLAHRRDRAATEPPITSHGGSARWLSTITGLTVPRAALVALVMSLNPKSLAVGAGAGLEIHAAQPGPGALAVAAATYTATAASTIAVPVTARVVTGDRLAPKLRNVHDRLLAHSPLVTDAVLILVGAVLLTRALTSA